jgi:hypothetical protein
MQSNINEHGNFISKVGEDIVKDIMGEDEIDSDCDEDMNESSDKMVCEDVDDDSLHQCMHQIFNTNKKIDTNKNNENDLVNEEVEIQNNNQRNNTTCHRLSLVPTFQEGIDILTKMKIVESRTKRRMR